MIAPLKRPPLQQPCPKQPASDRSADPFEAMLPEVCLYAWASFRRLEPEAREEAVQEAVAHALLTYRRLVEQGKADVAYPAVLARCGVLRVKDGRKVVGGQNGRDVLSPYCQRRKNIAVERLDRFDKESGEWIEAIVEDARTPVPDQVAFRIMVIPLTPVTPTYSVLGYGGVSKESDGIRHDVCLGGGLS